jgi:pSer/pThr/pTyr-binding forkhead associated (FHA) protein
MNLPSNCAASAHDGILLYDLRSTNGTYLNNFGVSMVQLEPMSIFRIGSSLLQLKTRA